MLGLRRDALIGLAVAGLMTGGLTGTIFAGPRVAEPSAEIKSPSDVPQQEAQEVPVVTGAAPVAKPISPLLGVVAALETAHARLHAGQGAVAGGRRMSNSFRQALQGVKKFGSLVQQLFRELGPGTFVSGGRLTALGSALVERLRVLHDHGLDPGNYGMPIVGQQVDRFVKRSAGVGVQAPVAAGPSGPVMVSMLQANNFDFDRALRRLENAGGAPSVAHVNQIAAAIGQVKASDTTTRQEHDLEVKLGAALVRFVLDFKILRKAGPFKVTRNEEAFAMYKRRPKRALKMMLAVAEAPDPKVALDALEPRHSQYPKLVEILKTYRRYVAADCQKKLPRTWELWKGKKNTVMETRRLQERLACEGYYTGAIDGVFDQDVKESVQTYQRHHMIDDGGFAKRVTMASLNVPIERRLALIALTLQRMRESAVNAADDFVIRVNIPAFEMQVFQGHEMLRRHKVIVGTNKLDDDKVKLRQGHINRTQLFKTKLYEVIVNPDWILPRRVEQGEIKNKLASNPNYLRDNNIRKHTLPSGRVVLIQGRCKHNVLGQVKFLLEKSRAIFLHDTNDRSMFRFDRRDFSHGCIRLQQAPKFAEWLLQRDGFSKEEIKRNFKAKRTQRGFKLRKPVELVTEYMTVDVSEEGLPVFLDDIYGYDRAFFQGKLPPLVTTRWGGPQLRPNWVPRVPEHIVEGWARSGQPAPSNYNGPVERNTP